jgi:inward rectifier potassium channel
MGTSRVTQLSEQEERDLGFGSVMSQQRRLRLLNRDGTFNVRRKGIRIWGSATAYHKFLTMSWTRFFLITALTYFVANAFFALMYLACGPGSLVNTLNSKVEPDFAQAFFFSVQTFATIGYGHIVPVGLAANLIVTFESLFGLLAFALATGLLFSRFSRPVAEVVFSRHAVIAPYRGITAFEFRVINARDNQLIELECHVVLSRFEKTGDTYTRQYYPLQLEREHVAFFPTSWTVVHPIDQSSPLYGITREQLLDSGAEFLILLTGIDETFAQTVNARSSYTATEVKWNARFTNILDRDPEQQTVSIDMDRFHAVEQLEA